MSITRYINDIISQKIEYQSEVLLFQKKNKNLPFVFLIFWVGFGEKDVGFNSTFKKEEPKTPVFRFVTLHAV